MIFFVDGYPASYKQCHQKKKQSFYLLVGEVKKLHRKISIVRFGFKKITVSVYGELVEPLSIV